MTLTEPPGSYDHCPVCLWEDDLSQLRWPTSHGANGLLSLIEAQRNFLATGIAKPALSWPTRPPSEDEPRAVNWRPIDLARDDFEEEPDGTVDMGRTYPADRTVLYYWSERFWRRR